VNPNRSEERTEGIVAAQHGVAYTFLAQQRQTDGP
jgi:hypothetical protein